MQPSNNINFFISICPAASCSNNWQHIEDALTMHGSSSAHVLTWKSFIVCQFFAPHYNWSCIKPRPRYSINIQTLKGGLITYIHRSAEMRIFTSIGEVARGMWTLTLWRALKWRVLDWEQSSHPSIDGIHLIINDLRAPKPMLSVYFEPCQIRCDHWSFRNGIFSTIAMSMRLLCARLMIEL